jgi:hypothetical protein
MARRWKGVCSENLILTIDRGSNMQIFMGINATDNHWANSLL